MRGIVRPDRIERIFELHASVRISNREERRAKIIETRPTSRPCSRT